MLQRAVEAERRRRRDRIAGAMRDRPRDVFSQAASCAAEWRVRPRSVLRPLNRSMLSASPACRAKMGRGLFSIHNPRDRKFAMTRCCTQPAWQHTSTFPSSASQIDRLGSRSYVPGHGAIQPAPDLRPPSALAIVSALMLISRPAASNAEAIRDNGASRPP